MKIIITGAAGQVGQELCRTCPEGIEIIALNRQDLNITDLKAVTNLVAELTPEVIINTAAYTAVDQAEQDQDTAFQVNAKGPENLALAAKTTGCRLIHISTDFIFEGTQGTPYKVDDAANPINTYGESKWQGEVALRNILGTERIVIRTSWVYGARGQNFVNTMIRLMQERDELSVVCDQTGTPTWAHGLAECIWRIVARPDLKGDFHWTDAGVASWYDFAVAIHEAALREGLLTRPVRIRPIASTAFPTPARRPAFSVLDKADSWCRLGLQPPHWRSNLNRMIKELNDNRDNRTGK